MGQSPEINSSSVLGRAAVTAQRKTQLVNVLAHGARSAAELLADHARRHAAADELFQLAIFASGPAVVCSSRTRPCLGATVARDASVEAARGRAIARSGGQAPAPSRLSACTWAAGSNRRLSSTCHVKILRCQHGRALVTSRQARGSSERDRRGSIEARRFRSWLKERPVRASGATIERFS